MKTVDLHVHSNKSDGSNSPVELVSLALNAGLSAFALTDHDTVAGIEEACKAAENTSLEVIPGIEFSTEYEGRDIHILGIDIDYKNSAFQTYLLEFQSSRLLRNKKMCERLNEYGVDISFSKLTACFPNSVITRAHYAKYLFSNGYVSSMQQAFERYIGDYAPCFIPREKVTPIQAVELILRANGIPILAHPILYGMGKERLNTLVASLREAGLMGIEAVYSTYSAADERQIRALAKKFDLEISGGSDFHGTTKPNLNIATGYGSLFIPEEILTALRRRNDQWQSSSLI